MLKNTPFRRYAEEHFKINAKMLHKLKDSGRIVQLKSDIQIELKPDGESLIASYSLQQDELLEQIITFTTSQVGYGQRVFVQCPKCKKAVNDLYFRKRFACRNCHGLYYTSNRKQRNELERLKLTIKRTQNALKMPINRTLTDYPTQKPLNMHTRTYERLLTELLTAQTKYVKRQNEELERLYGRFK